MKRKLLWTASAIAALVALAAFGACAKPAETKRELKITLDQTVLELKAGEQATLKATLSQEGFAVSWSTEDPAVATVEDGRVAGVAPGSTVITASSGAAKATCAVTVTEPAEPSKPTIEIAAGSEELRFHNYQKREDVDLLAGLSAKDGAGEEIEVRLKDDGGLDLATLGEYTLTYEAADAQGQTVEITRKAYVDYFGISKADLQEKELSVRTAWSYGDTEKTAEEWSKHNAPGHNPNWNRFEGPFTELILHGSDTEGHDPATLEQEDEYPNAMLWNRVTVPQDNTIFRVYASNNPYPEYNNLLSKFRVSVISLADWVCGSSEYVTLKAPLNAEGNNLDVAKMRTRTYADFDLSEYAGREVLLFIEQDSPTEVYQKQYFIDIGMLDIQAEASVNETRDSLVIYSMSFLVPEQLPDLSSLKADDSQVWGTDDADAGKWGMRGDEAAKAKWTWFNLSNAPGNQVVNVTGTGGSMQSIAFETQADDDGDIRADAMFANRVTPAKGKFQITVGTDGNDRKINLRVRVVEEDGTVTTLSPASYGVLADADRKLQPDTGYTPLSNGWGRVQASQWVYGVQLTYDFSAFVGKTVVILIEQDAVWSGEGAQPDVALWFNKAAFAD